MATIFPWHTIEANKSAPYIRTSSGGYFLQQGTVQKVAAPPSGAASAKVLSCHIKGTSPAFNQYYKVKYGEWWGLITSNNVDFKIVRLWELTIAVGYAGIFAGYPKKNQTYSGPTATWAAFTLGETYQEGIGQRLPLFYRYPQNRNTYYQILSTDEMKKFPIGRATNQTSPPPVSSPPPSSRPTTSPFPDFSGLIPSTGAGSGTGITIGTQVTGMPFPDFSGLLGYTPPPTKTGPNKNKPGGVYVVGPDGKKIYIPPGLDFSGFKQPPPPPKPETKIVVRMPKGYAPPFSTAGTKPRMTQRQLDLTDSGRAIGTVTDTFIFPYIPQNIRYSDIGSDWREIPRAMNASFVDWSGYKLMKVSMDFLVSAQYIPSIKDEKTKKVIAQGTAVSDGLMNSVTNELNMLRRMATNKFPVTLEGFDDILQIQMARSRFEQPRGIQFVIQDLNITAGRRTIDETTGLATTPSLISAAQVSITLQEIPVETVSIVKLPPLKLGNPIIGKGGGGGVGVDNLGLQSGTLIAPWTIATPTET